MNDEPKGRPTPKRKKKSQKQRITPEMMHALKSKIERQCVDDHRLAILGGAAPNGMPVSTVKKGSGAAKAMGHLARGELRDDNETDPGE